VGLLDSPRDETFRVNKVMTPQCWNTGALDFLGFALPTLYSFSFFTFINSS
jgi:hypothetical protein